MSDPEDVPAASESPRHQAWGRARTRWAAFRRALAARGVAELAALLVPFLEIYRKILLPVAIVLVIVLVSLLYQESILEDLVQQVANRWAAPRGEKVVVVAIDDATLAAIAPETDSRGFVQALVARIAEARPRAIGVDYVFLPQLGSAPLPASRERSARGRKPALTRLAGRVPLVVGSIAVKTGDAWTDVTPDPSLVDPITMNWGHAYVARSKDAGQIRTIRMDYAGDRDLPIPAFSLALWAAGHGMTGTDLRDALQRCWLVDEAAAPAAQCPPELRERRGDKRIRYGPPGLTFDALSAARLLDGRYRPSHVYYARMTALLRDRYVLVGATHRQGADRLPTPLATRIPLLGNTQSLFGDEPLTPGTVIHGYALQNLLSNGFIKPYRAGGSMLLLTVSLAVPVLVCVLTAGRRWLLASDGQPRRWWGDAAWIMGASVLLSGALFAYAVWVLLNRLEAVPLGLCIPLILLGALGSLLLRYYVARVEDSQYRELLSRHAGPYFAGSEARYHALIGNPTPVLAVAVHRPYRPELEAPAAFEQSLRAVQRRLAELIDPPPEGGVLPIIDNWGFNRVTLYLHCTDGPRLAAQRQAGLQLVLPKLIDLAEDASRDGLGRVSVAVGWGDVVVVDIASPCERGVLTVSGGLLDELVRLTEPRPDGDPLVIVTNLADEERLIRALAVGYRVDKYPGDHARLVISRR